MVFERMEQNPGMRFLFIMAMVVVVSGGLKVAAPILLPFFLALFLAILTLPVVVWLRQRRVPGFLAILLAALMVLALFGLAILLVTQSMSDVQARLPSYVEAFGQVWARWLAGLEQWSFPGAASLAEGLSAQRIDSARVVSLAGGTLQRAFTFASNAFLVFLILVFVLGEAMVFPAKFRAILGRERGHSSRLTKIVAEVQAYLWIKTFISLATGVLLGAWCWVLDLDFPVLLGLLAFLLNYIPTVGSILASVPAILLALVQHGLGTGLATAGGYLAVNMVLGNFLDPHLTGRRLGLSTLVVILSLLFWGWLWGPVGALLAVPMTMIVKIMLQNTPDLRWVAILLDKSPPDPGGEGGFVEEWATD
jgi:predicted PurR-regulated permease PerM